MSKPTHITISWAYKGHCVLCDKKGCYCIHAEWAEGTRPTDTRNYSGHVDMCAVCIHTIYGPIIEDKILDTIPDDGTKVDIEYPSHPQVQCRNIDTSQGPFTPLRCQLALGHEGRHWMSWRPGASHEWDNND